MGNQLPCRRYTAGLFLKQYAKLMMFKYAENMCLIPENLNLMCNQCEFQGKKQLEEHDIIPHSDPTVEGLCLFQEEYF